MANPQPQTPAPTGGKKKGADKPPADYKALIKSIKDACDAAAKALAPLCVSQKNDEGKDTSPPTDLFGKTISADVSVYKSEYMHDITIYTGSKPRTTKASTVRDSVVAARNAMIKAYDAAQKAAADLDEAQSILDTQRKLYLSNNKVKMAAKLEAKKKQELTLAAQRKKLEAELAQA